MKRLFAIAIVAWAAAGRAEVARPEYRAYWVETFRTSLATRVDVQRVVDAAVSSHANALFVEVRRRGDSWYLDSAEPLTEVPGVGEPDAVGRWTFDPLRELIERAHARGIEVHAFVIVAAVARLDPRGDPLPRDARHVFLQHIWDAEAKRPFTGRRQWATRAAPHNVRGTSYDGQRFGDDWYIDLGHPDAAAYTVDVLTHLVRAYDIDGIHLDRVRYPEAPIDRARGERMGVNVGYNETSVERFKARYGNLAHYDAAGYPRSNDPLWNDWRREQVTNFVRRFYLSAKAIRPSIKISAALIAWSNGPRASGGFEATEAYSRVFQDWPSWLREGIIDLASPMLYKREHAPMERKQFDDWLTFLIAQAHQSGRAAVPGVGAYMNAVEGSLRQAARARKAGADGVIFFAIGDTTPQTVRMNSTNRAVPPKPKRTNEEFFAALARGPFAAKAAPPAAPSESTGSVFGLAPLDGASVAIESDAVHRKVNTDGGGFFGALKLPPGEYRAMLRDNACAFRISAGLVARIDIPCHLTVEAPQ
jgi:uncharacterized lipoprotein YddW (UPF0748 family)